MTKTAMASRLIDDVRETEGPAFAPDGSFYITEMAPGRSCVTRIADGRRHPVATTAGRPNGLAIDGDGDLWIAEGREGTVLRLSPDGRVKMRIEGDADGRFLWPNDLAFGPDGLLYMTDSGVLDLDLIPADAIVESWSDLPYDGRLYRIDPATGRVLDTLDRGFRFTNGIAFGPDGALYINETLTGAVYRYALDASGPPRRETYGNVLPDREAGRFYGPDGMKFDQAGQLWCTIFGHGSISVLDAAGRLVSRLPVGGARPTNLAFHPTEPRIYVTEGETNSVLMFDVEHPGLALHMPHVPG